MRTSLFEPASLRLELIKLDCLRVVLPFIIAHRLIPQALSAVCIQKWLEFALSGLGVVLCVLICIGIAESWAAVLLALMLSPVIDNYCFSTNLGSVFATSLLWLIAFSFPGQVFSLHRLLGKNNERVFSRGKFFGRPRLETVAALKFLVLLSYSLVCWESAYRHWQADTWRSGEICCLIFLSPVSNPHFFQFFETFYLNFPVLYTQLFKIVTYSTLIWMSTFPIPLFFGGIIRSLAILFWLSFLLADAFVLPLMGNLGAIQLAMWIVLFCPNVVWKAALLRLRLKRRAEPTSALDKPRFAHNSLYNYSPFAIAYACSVLVFSVVFCLRSPFLDGKWMPAPLTILIRRERAIMGQSFLPVGLTNLNVFNDLDRSIMFLGLDHIFFDHQGKEMKIPYLIPDSMRARFLQRQRSQCAFYYDSLQESVLLEIAAYLKRLNPGLHTYQVNYVSYAEPEFLAAQAGAGARSGKQVD